MSAASVNNIKSTQSGVGPSRFSFLIVFSLFLSLLVIACSSYQPINVPLAERSVNLSNIRLVRQILYSELREWDSVGYRMGGLSKDGVDCSGLVYIIYRSRFGIPLPRRTYEQSRVGREVAQQQLRPGDLVFFRTGRHINHVGIYLDHRRFLHVSTRSGVMVSSLDNVYWAKKYWKSMRVHS